MPGGQIIILNGAPRSGKSTLARILIDRLPGPWINLGVDAIQAATPQRLLPGMGLRPGGERPDLEPFVVAAFEAVYAAVRSFSAAGVGVVVDVGHHDDYSQPLRILERCARQVEGRPVLFVGVRCTLETAMARRLATWGTSATPEQLRRWDQAVHVPGSYDVEVDTSALTPDSCAEVIERRLAEGPSTAFFRAIRGSR